LALALACSAYRRGLRPRCTDGTVEGGTLSERAESGHSCKYGKRRDGAYTGREYAGGLSKPCANGFPGADNATVARIQELFPYPPDNPKELAWDWGTEILFSCNAEIIAESYGDKARRYVMSVPPATHGEGTSCEYFSSNPTMLSHTISQSLSSQTTYTPIKACPCSAHP